MKYKVSSILLVRFTIDSQSLVFSTVSNVDCQSSLCIYHTLPFEIIYSIALAALQMSLHFAIECGYLFFKINFVIPVNLFLIEIHAICCVFSPQYINMHNI